MLFLILTNAIVYQPRNKKIVNSPDNTDDDQKVAEEGKERTKNNMEPIN